MWRGKKKVFLRKEGGNRLRRERKEKGGKNLRSKKINCLLDAPLKYSRREEKGEDGV